jgi:hypothetical protein
MAGDQSACWLASQSRGDFSLIDRIEPQQETESRKKGDVTSWLNVYISFLPIRILQDIISGLLSMKKMGKDHRYEENAISYDRSFICYVQFQRRAIRALQLLSTFHS